MDELVQIRFQCQGCSYCCAVEPGFVFLSRQDVKALADHLGITERQVLEKYCRVASLNNKTAFSLNETESYDCIFLKDKRCSVYEARPTQCRTYPFWASILKSRQAWLEESQYCPGIGQGPVLDEEFVKSRLKEEADNEIILLDI
ncbi:MAG: YkgJ family cysteine cluster protein [Sphaerochaetaceae bacterium]|jgi:Fe-S-cluster containining protein